MSEKHTHTPGPWKVCRGDWSEDGNARYELEGISVIGRADAQLIEASPDLLEALRLMVNDDFPGLPLGEQARRLTLADEAIAKATE